MAKAPDDAQLIEGLLKAMSGQPLRQVADKTSPGIFPAGATGKKLAQRAIDQGYLEPCDGPAPPTPPKKSAKPKAIPHARITAKGQEWVLRQTTPRQALEGLLAAFHQQSEAYRGQDTEMGVLQAALGDLQNSFNRVQEQVSEAAARRRSETRQLVETIQTAVAAVRQALAAGDAVSVPVQPPPTAQDLDAPLLAYVRSWQQQRGADCPLPDLFRHLRGRRTDLTIGGFHDLLRVLYRRRQLELTPWSGTLDNLSEPELALFISNTVMYYAHVPSQHR